MPALDSHTALRLIMPQVVISTEISSITRLRFNPTYGGDHQAWLYRVVNVQKRITKPCFQ